jgi:hypothetical protein
VIPSQCAIIVLLFTLYFFTVSVIVFNVSIKFLSLSYILIFFGFLSFLILSSFLIILLSSNKYLNLYLFSPQLFNSFLQHLLIELVLIFKCFDASAHELYILIILLSSSI